MTHIADATLAELAHELDRAAVAIALGITPRKWRAYAKAIRAEMLRRYPVPPELANITDEELLRELSSNP